MRTPACRLKPWWSAATSLLSGARPWSSSAAIGVAGTRERRELTALHGDRRAGIKGALRLRTLPGQTVVEVAAPAQPSDGLPTSALDDGAEPSGARRRRRVKEHATLGIAREHAIEHKCVKVHVEVQAAEALNTEHRAALGALDPGALRTRAVGRERGLNEDAGQGGERVGLEGGKPAQLERQRQDVLAHRHVGQDPVDQVRRAVGHAPARAARADRPAVTREGNEQIVTAGVAMAPGEALAEHPHLRYARSSCSTYRGSPLS